jgi:hypothetical protein
LLRRRVGSGLASGGAAERERAQQQQLATMAAGTSTAQARWELENAVASTSAAEADALYRYDPQEQQTIQQQKPWQKDPTYFKQ